MERLPKIWLLGILVGVPLLFHLDVAFLGRTFESRLAWYDALSGGLFRSHFKEISGAAYAFNDPAATYVYNEPTAMLITQSIAKGTLPFWVSKIGLGTRVVENIQSGIFFPLHWIAYLVPDALGLDLMMLARLAVSFAGFFLFLHWSWRLSPLSALVGAVVFAFTGHGMAKVNMHSSNVYAALPFYLMGWHLCLKETRKGIAVMAVSLAAMVLAGFPQATLGGLYFGALYGMGLLWHRRKEIPTKKAVLVVVVGHGLALLLAAPELFPLVDDLRGLPKGYREGTSETGISFSPFLFYLFFPNRGAYFSLFHPGWLGPLPIFVSLLGAFLLFLRKEGFFIFFVAPALYLVKALNVPLFSDLIVRLPFVSTVHFSRDFSVFLWVPISFFAGYAIQALTNHDEKARLRAIRPAAVVFVFFLLWAVWHVPQDFLERLKSQGAWQVFMKKSHGYAVPVLLTLVYFIWLGLKTRSRNAGRVTAIFTLVFVFFTIHRAKPKRVDLQFEKFTSLTKVAEIAGPLGRVGFLPPFHGLPAPVTALFGIDGFRDIDAFLSARYIAYVNQFFRGADKPCCDAPVPITKDPLTAWRAVGVTHLVGPVKPPMGYERLESVAEFSDFTLYGVEGSLPKAFLAKGDDGQVLVTRYDGTEVEISVNALRDSTLVLTDLYRLNWEALIDDKLTPIFPFDSTFRGITVPAGKHIVMFRYVSRPFRAGVFCAGFAGIALLLLLLTGRIRRSNDS